MRVGWLQRYGRAWSGVHMTIALYRVGLEVEAARLAMPGWPSR